MKKLLLPCLLMLTLAVHAQKAAPEAQQASQQPFVDTSRQLAVILTENEFNALMQLIRAADEKPSIVNAWMNLLAARRNYLPASNKQPATNAKPK